MQKVKFDDAKSSDILEYKEMDSLNIEFKLTHIDKADNKKNLSATGKATNIDPEGLNSLDFLDPAGKDNPISMYSFEQGNKSITILLPLEVGLNYAGIWIDDKDDTTHSNRYERKLDSVH